MAQRNVGRRGQSEMQSGRRQHSPRLDLKRKGHRMKMENINKAELLEKIEELLDIYCGGKEEPAEPELRSGDVLRYGGENVVYLKDAEQADMIVCASLTERNYYYRSDAKLYGARVDTGIWEDIGNDVEDREQA